MEAIRPNRQGPIDVNLMVGNPRPQEGNGLADYGAIAKAVNERMLAPSHLTQFFTYVLRSPEQTSPSAMSDRFFGARLGAGRDTLNVALFLIDGRREWVDGKDPSQMKEMLARFAERTELLGYSSKGECTADAVRRVEAALVENLAAVGQAASQETAALAPPSNHRPGRERLQRQQILTLRRDPPIVKQVNDLLFALSSAALISKQDTIFNLLVNELASYSMIPVIQGLQAPASPERAIDEGHIRRFLFLDSAVRARVLDVTEVRAESMGRQMPDGERITRARQVYANLMDAVPAKAAAETFRHISAPKASILLELMEPKRAARVLDGLVSSDEQRMVSHARSIYQLVHPDCEEDIRANMGEVAKVKIPQR
jgi:hypothetical protein